MAIIYRGIVGGNYQYWNENEATPMGATDITSINIPVLTASHVDRSVYARDGISGSLQTLTGSQPYLLGGPNITLLTNSLGQIEISGSGGSGGITTLQQAYDVGAPNAPIILLNATSSSLILSGGFLGVNDPLLKLRPFHTSGSTLFGYGNCISLMGYDGTNERSLLTMTSVTSLFGGAKILMRSTGDVNSFIGWLGGSGDLNNSTVSDALVYYHPNASALKLETNGSKKVAIIDNGPYGGGTSIAEFRNALSFAGPLIILSGSTISEKGFSGSLTTLRDGQPYMIAGPNITINTSSLGQIVITGSGGGGGGGDVYWSSTTNNSIFTTGSVLIRSNDGSGTDAATDYGNDNFFYVSGAIGSRGGSTAGVSTFGGDVVVSGNLHIGPTLTIGSDVGFFVSGSRGGQSTQTNSTGMFGGDLAVSGNLHQLSGLRVGVNVITSITPAYTASILDYIIAVSASAGLGVTLPSNAQIGKTYIVKDVSGSATTNNILISGSSGERINGVLGTNISSDWGSLQFVYFGSTIGWGTI